MKSVIFASLIAGAAAFAPTQVAESSSALNAYKGSSKAKKPFEGELGKSD